MSDASGGIKEAGDGKRTHDSVNESSSGAVGGKRIKREDSEVQLNDDHHRLTSTLEAASSATDHLANALQNVSDSGELKRTGELDVKDSGLHIEGDLMSEGQKGDDDNIGHALANSTQAIDDLKSSNMAGNTHVEVGGGGDENSHALAGKLDLLKRLHTQPASINITQSHGIQGLNTSNIDRPMGNQNSGTQISGIHNSGNSGTQNSGNTNKAAQTRSNDPTKFNDALVAAGIDIQQEEDLLMQQNLNKLSRYNLPQQQQYQRQQQQQQQQQQAAASSLLNPYHLAVFMQRVARENGISQNFSQDPELLELMSASCQNWISDIVTKTIIFSRHRRRGIPNLGKGKKLSSSSIPRSELSKELRNLAVKQKELEEKRVSKRILLGLEKSGPEADGDISNSKAGAEETLHRAANATAALMANPGRKKYSWMDANSSTTNGDDSTAGDKDGSKQSSILSVRGDNGLRYREIRTGNSVTMKDLLAALEDERMGVERALVKGYAKLKD